ncbi:MAG: MarR family transcriptional regulator [Candidatus Bathyarchaeota archaeon]|nr:MarR family transcriptional regulator [Candidatus Bathyarchaeota archaeon]
MEFKILEALGLSERRLTLNALRKRLDCSISTVHKYVKRLAKSELILLSSYSDDRKDSTPYVLSHSGLIKYLSDLKGMDDKRWIFGEVNPKKPRLPLQSIQFNRVKCINRAMHNHRYSTVPLFHHWVSFYNIFGVDACNALMDASTLCVRYGRLNTSDLTWAFLTLIEATCKIDVARLEISFRSDLEKVRAVVEHATDLKRKQIARVSRMFEQV